MAEKHSLLDGNEDNVTKPNAHLGIRIVSTLSLALPVVLGQVISNKEANRAYDLRVTPPGLFFSIWGLIYANFLITTVYATIKDVWHLRTWVYYFAWNIVVAGWTLSFTSVTDAGLIISFVLILSSLFIMEAMWQSLINNKKFEGWIALYTHNSYALCVGWLVAACNLAIGIMLTHFLKLSYKAQMGVFWAMVPLSVGLFYLWHYRKAPVVSSIGLVLSTTWAVVGAIISSTKGWPRVRGEQPANVASYLTFES